MSKERRIQNLYTRFFSILIDLIDIDNNSRLSLIIVDRSTLIDNQNDVDHRRLFFFSINFLTNS